MTSDTTPITGQAAREARLSKALRTNLHRRRPAQNLAIAAPGGLGACSENGAGAGDDPACDGAPPGEPLYRG